MQGPHKQRILNVCKSILIISLCGHLGVAVCSRERGKRLEEERGETAVMHGGTRDLPVCVCVCVCVCVLEL